MEIISKEEFDKLPVKSGKFSSVRGFINQLNSNQAVIITPDEWKLKTHLNALIKQAYRKERSEKDFIVRTLKDNKGWAVLRIK